MGKTPQAKMGLNFCPLIKQGCVGEHCSWWVTMTGVDKDGKPHLDESCSIPWLVILGKGQLVETARTSASYDKVASMTGSLGRVIAERVSPLPQ